MQKHFFKPLTILACFALSTTASALPLDIQQSSNNGSTYIVTASSNMTTGAENFIDKLSNQALSFLADEKLSHTEKKQEFKNLLSNNFDMLTIGRFALGRYWRPATKQQKTKYLKLFNKMVIEVYSQRFADYQGQAFQITNAKADSDKDTIVSSYIVQDGDGPKVSVDWRVRYKNGKYRVIDVIVEGVSMSVTQRSDFSSVIQRGGGNVDVLLKHLESIVDKG